ncbi:hypothetical protein CIHG_01583 [Coccidioides immitis H538.4]|uniref:Uncharacterized protein n=3 Tax=Coccidioides immitis TaxID=5501 RepID=A0A0J8QTN5_COCIT|nr:hypothetical protein CIRG_01433 [Coccidioides immitis RMSCC 2394]KMU75420.1 hypothetical protein CISG_05055 [Coccidioides immitis RMSCC 3703]KMU83799.1 hypothetical protein CIHG_01583 [Coccidioides immitis H538.4]
MWSPGLSNVIFGNEVALLNLGKLLPDLQVRRAVTVQTLPYASALGRSLEARRGKRGSGFYVHTNACSLASSRFRPFQQDHFCGNEEDRVKITTLEKSWPAYPWLMIPIECLE